MPEITITEKTIEKPASNILEIPEIAWQGLFRDYRELVGPTTEASDNFHFAAFMQVLGCTLGRRLFVYHAAKLFPNFYNCPVGRSGSTRKDTAWSRAESILEALHVYPHDITSPNYKSVRGLRSVEGLLDELAGEGKVRLIILGELLSLLSKAKQDSIGNIIPALTELYDMKDVINPPVHQRDVKPAIEPFVSIMAGTTLDWLQKALTERDIYGGFANRWCFFYGLPKPPLPNPPKVNKEKRNELVSAINNVRIWADSITDGEITISVEADRLFQDYYRSYYSRFQQPGLIPTLIVRIQDFVWKMALLYAADSMSDVITRDHLEPAIAVGDYLESSVGIIFANFGASRGKALEQKVIDFLKNEGRQVPEREVYRRLSMSADELSKAVSPLVRLGLVKNSFITGGNNRKVRVYEVVSERETLENP